MLATETTTREQATNGAGSEAEQATGLMKDGDQSRKDVPTPIAILVTPKRWIRVGCWNVRTLYQTRKLAQVVSELNRNNLTLMGVTEARWTDSGKQKVSSGEVIIWSGRTDNDHREGVVVIISKSKANTVLQWKPVNEHLLYVRMNSKYVKLSVVVGYALIDDAGGEDKDAFYDALQSV
ncbi:craniofacial development protein 2-like [Dreissena polymorpha]|uniref:craniofacial development protein 2-like n=1 Tax=Dreissena polymorpha TaxID=45954 RepID=UPI002264317E|nr:craniofacial development protein 2-like [Dreissena polymorpha]